MAKASTRQHQQSRVDWHKNPHTTAMKNALKLIPAALYALCLSAQADVMIAIQEVGNDVVLTGVGSIDTLNGLVADEIMADSISGMVPDLALIVHGDGSSNQFAMYPVPISPANFGTGGISFPTSATGSFFGLLGSNAPDLESRLFIPQNATLPYPVSFTFTFAGLDFSDLGLTNGKYVWRWGTPEDGDAVTLCIGPIQPCPDSTEPTMPTPVPSLGAIGLIGLAGAIGAAGAAMTRRRKG